MIEDSCNRFVFRAVNILLFKLFPSSYFASYILKNANDEERPKITLTCGV